MIYKTKILISLQFFFPPQNVSILIFFLLYDMFYKFWLLNNFSVILFYLSLSIFNLIF